MTPPTKFMEFFAAIEKGDLPEFKRRMEEWVGFINTPSKAHSTPLCCAVRYNHIEIIQFLCDYGADPNLADKDGRTALMYAAYRGRLEAVNVLLKNGSNPNLADKDGWTALSFAEKYGHAEIVRVLRAAMAK